MMLSSFGTLGLHIFVCALTHVSAHGSPDLPFLLTVSFSAQKAGSEKPLLMSNLTWFEFLQGKRATRLLSPQRPCSVSSPSQPDAGPLGTHWNNGCPHWCSPPHGPTPWFLVLHSMWRCLGNLCGWVGGRAPGLFPLQPEQLPFNLFYVLKFT